LLKSEACGAKAVAAFRFRNVLFGYFLFKEKIPTDAVVPQWLRSPWHTEQNGVFSLSTQPLGALGGPVHEIDSFCNLSGGFPPSQNVSCTQQRPRFDTAENLAMENRAAGTNSGVEEDLPLQFHLSQNYPNPFTERTTIKYCVAYKTRIRLTVFDSGGNEIEKLVDEEKNPGTYEVEFCVTRGKLPDGTTERDYYYKLEAGRFGAEKQMQLIK
jgi:hypothetical protein